MTREEAIVHIKDIICESNSTKPNIVVFEQEKEALYMAIKALEQEPILDKIRAEIGRKANSGQWSEAVIYGMQKSIAIIDKYKVESEGYNG